MSQRAQFLQCVLNAIGSPYRWGGKGNRPYDLTPDQRVFDCSGLVTWAYREVGGPDWRATHNTDRLLAECLQLPPGDIYVPGDLVFYGTWSDSGLPDPSHVMVLAGAGVVVGACGGDSSTTTLEAAVRQGAKVQVKASLDYRTDFLCVGRLPFADE